MEKTPPIHSSSTPLSFRAKIGTWAVVGAVGAAIMANLYRNEGLSSRYYNGLLGVGSLTLVSPWIAEGVRDVAKLSLPKSKKSNAPPAATQPKAPSLDETIRTKQDALRTLVQLGKWDVYEERIADLKQHWREADLALDRFDEGLLLLSITLELIENHPDNRELRQRADSLLQELSMALAEERDPVRTEQMEADYRCAYERHLVVTQLKEIEALAEGLGNALQILDNKESPREEFDRADAFIRRELIYTKAILHTLPDGETKEEIEETVQWAEEMHCLALQKMIEGLEEDHGDPIIACLEAGATHLFRHDAPLLEIQRAAHEELAKLARLINEREPNCQRTEFLRNEIADLFKETKKLEISALSQLKSKEVQPDHVPRDFPDGHQEIVHAIHQAELATDVEIVKTWLITARDLLGEATPKAAPAASSWFSFGWFNKSQPSQLEESLQKVTHYYQQRMRRLVSLHPTLYAEFVPESMRGAWTSIRTGLPASELNQRYKQKMEILVTIELPLWLTGERELPFGTKFSAGEPLKALLSEIVHGYQTLLQVEEDLEWGRWSEAKRKLDEVATLLLQATERLEREVDKNQVLTADGIKVHHAVIPLLAAMRKEMQKLRKSGEQASIAFAAQADLLEKAYRKMQEYYPDFLDEGVNARVAELRSCIVYEAESAAT